MQSFRVQLILSCDQRMIKFILLLLILFYVQEDLIKNSISLKFLRQEFFFISNFSVYHLLFMKTKIYLFEDAGWGKIDKLSLFSITFSIFIKLIYIIFFILIAKKRLDICNGSYELNGITSLLRVHYQGIKIPNNII